MGPNGPLLEQRLRAKPVGLIGDDGLVDPTELLAYVGKPPAGVLRGARPTLITSFDHRVGAALPLDLTALLVIILLASVALIPLAIFITTVTRLSAGTREARFAAVRLAGGTQSQVRWLAGLEAAFATLAGSLLGIPLFLACRPLLAGGVLLGDRFFPQDFSPPTAIVIAAVLGLPAVAVGVTLATMRRLVISPLGIVRRHRRKQVRSLWPVVLVIGIALLAWAASQHAGIIARGQIAAEAILGLSLALTTIGLAGTAVWMAWLLARLLASRAPGVPALLGLRRLEADPSSSARMVGGVAVLIALFGVVNAGWLSQPSASRSATLAPWVRALSSTDVIVVPFGGRSLPQMATLASTPGVTSVRMSRQLPDAGEFSRRITGVIETDGQPSTIEGIRQAVGWVASVDTVQDLRSAAASTVRSDAALLGTPLRLVTFFLLAVIGASFLVALVDWIVERRRSLAVLSAMGVSRAVIRVSLLFQIAVPLLTSTLMGVVGGLTVTFLLYTAVESKVVFPLSQLATIAGAVVAMIAGTTALAAPWLRTTRRAELLRNE
jgi:hypothetical protein